MRNAAPPAPVKPKPARPHVAPVQPKPETPLEPPYHVILLDDDDHSYDYVIEMLGSIFAYSFEKAYKMACEVDKTGRVIVATVHKELAELRCEQIQTYGPDPASLEKKESMRAIIEPAE